MQTSVSAGESRQIQVSGINTEVWEAGSGRPLLLLHPGDGFDAAAPYVSELAGRYRVIAPSHPGFGRSDLPKWMKSVDDLSYFYLDFMKQQNIEDALVVGLSFGGWIAAEIAIKSTARMAGLCLVDTVGAKFSAPTEREIFDLFSYPQYEQAQWIYQDEALRKKSYADLPDDIALQMARNHESFCIYGWSPTLHSRHMVQRLHRIDVPTQLIWGAQDRIVGLDYANKWQQGIPGATLTVIDHAGHYPQIEQPRPFVAAVERFANTLAAR